MSDIKVTIEKDGKTVVLRGRFAVVGTVRNDGSEMVLSTATSGSATAYAAAMLGCQVVAKMTEQFDAMEPVRPDSEV